MSTKKKKPLLVAGAGVAALAVSFVVAMLVYRSLNTMRVTQAHSLGDPQADHKVLLATQGSDYKDQVLAAVEQLILETHNLAVDVVDVTQLDTLPVEPYQRAVILTTIQSGDVPQPVYRFAARFEGPCQVVYTAASRQWKGRDLDTTAQIDAVSSASSLQNQQAVAQEMVDFWLGD